MCSAQGLDNSGETDREKAMQELLDGRGLRTLYLLSRSRGADGIAETVDTTRLALFTGSRAHGASDGKCVNVLYVRR
jgi:hypothetical protein